MKRSKSLSLVLMGSLVLGSSGCGSNEVPEEFATFRSVNECVTSGLFTEAECREFAQTAALEQPRFNSKEECEQKFGAGACEGPAENAAAAPAPSSNGTAVQQRSGSMWMPMMMGFMAGRYMGSSGPMQGSQGLYGTPSQQPGSGTQTFRTATGDTVTSDAKGRVTSPTSAMKQSISHNAKPITGRSGSGARGGFGRTGGGGS